MSQKSMSEVKAEIAEMSFGQVLTYAAAMDGFTPVPVCTALTRRLYEISLYDHHVPQEHRKHAWELLTAIKASVEGVLKGDPAALVSYLQANAGMEAKVSFFGVGSLAWQIEEEGISSKETLIYR